MDIEISTNANPSVNDLFCVQIFINHVICVLQTFLFDIIIHAKVEIGMQTTATDLTA
jgi:hypothetical protein